MKSKTIPIFLIIIALSFYLCSCKNTIEKPVKTEINTVVKVTEDNKGTIDSPAEKETEKNTIPDSFKNRLRPDEQLELGKVYTDTVTFLSYDDNFDYWYFLAIKNKDTVQIMYQDDVPINELIKEDKVVIKWELNILKEAGDEEITYVKPYLASFNKISSKQPVDKKTTILWRETLYNEALKTNINTIVLNKDYQKDITEAERAALGYVATFVGNECEWDGGSPDENRGNLDCKLLSYLELGYQCSEKHLGFLNNWFSKDSIVLSKLKRCPTIPDGATKQSTFDEISMETNTETQTITICYKVKVVNVRESSVRRYTKADTFKYNSDGIFLIDSEKRANNSFVISCGSGCAMIYTEDKIVTNNNSSEVTFKVEMFVNEILSKEYYETYIYTCNPSNDDAEIELKEDGEFNIGNLHSEVLKQLKLNIPKLCTN